MKPKVGDKVRVTEPSWLKIEGIIEQIEVGTRENFYMVRVKGQNGLHVLQDYHRLEKTMGPWYHMRKTLDQLQRTLKRLQARE